LRDRCGVNVRRVSVSLATVVSSVALPPDRKPEIASADVPPTIATKTLMTTIARSITISGAAPDPPMSPACCH
jgi:hypothetical protein